METSIIPLVWREEDQALLDRLEDELVFARVWAAELAGAHGEPPPRRASGLIRLLRDRPGGAAAASDALEGRLDAMLALLVPSRLAGLAPPLLHHLALYHARAAGEASSAPRAATAHVRSLAAWIALAEERDYLLALGRAVVGSGLPEAELERCALSVAADAIDALGSDARAGARDRRADAAAALAALERVPEASRIAGVSDPVARELYRRAARARAAAIEEALAPVREALAEAAARGGVTGASLVARFAAVWRWTEGDETVEQAAVKETAALLWEHYRAGRWAQLREMLAPLEPLVNRLAQRIEADPTRVAYAAPCAQLLVFRAECAAAEDVQLATLEWALRICPSHRNGRLVLASTLCERAIRTLERGPLAGVARGVDAAAADVARAEELYPASKRLDEARQKLAAARGRR